ncbi:MAG: hypothetical protein KGL55_02720, partial [Rhodospirillales bacterium]|nr:hypothetical protein [Rhodospirillales bacterium]
PEPPARPARADERRDDRRERRRDDDLGPAVRGFGADIPAFMMIPARAKHGAAPAEAVEATEA